MKNFMDSNPTLSSCFIPKDKEDDCRNFCQSIFSKISGCTCDIEIDSNSSVFVGDSIHKAGHGIFEGLKSAIKCNNNSDGLKWIKCILQDSVKDKLENLCILDYKSKDIYTFEKDPENQINYQNISEIDPLNRKFYQNCTNLSNTYNFPLNFIFTLLIIIFFLIYYFILLNPQRNYDIQENEVEEINEEENEIADDFLDFNSSNSDNTDSDNESSDESIER